MTLHHSTILDDIDFKLRLIKHFEKVYHKCVNNPATQKLMIEQTQRLDDEIWNLVTSNKDLNKPVGKLERKYILKEWFIFTDSTREATGVNS